MQTLDILLKQAKTTNNKQGVKCILHFFWHRDEANDEVKVNVLSGIGAWLRHAAKLPASVAKRLADSLKEKDALKAAALSATLQVIFCTPVDSSLSDCLTTHARSEVNRH